MSGAPRLLKWMNCGDWMRYQKTFMQSVMTMRTPGRRQLTSMITYV